MCSRPRRGYRSTITTSRRGPWTPSTRCSSMSDVAEGPETSTIGRPPAASASSCRMSSGTVSTICSSRTTQTCRSGSRVSARRPWPGPPSKASVPVAAHAAAHVVTTPSSWSSCAGRRVVRDELDAGRAQPLGEVGADRRSDGPPARRGLGDRGARVVGVDDHALCSRARARRTWRRSRRARLPAVTYRRATRAASPRRWRVRTAREDLRHERSRDLPPLAEGLAGDGGEVAAAAPGAERPGREAAEPPPADERPLDEPARAAARARSRGGSGRRVRAARSRPLPRCAGLRRPCARSFTRSRRDVDPHGADVGAGAAQGGRERQRRRGPRPPSRCGCRIAPIGPAYGVW